MLLCNTSVSQLLVLPLESGETATGINPYTSSFQVRVQPIPTLPDLSTPLNITSALSFWRLMVDQLIRGYENNVLLPRLQQLNLSSIGVGFWGSILLMYISN